MDLCISTVFRDVGEAEVESRRSVGVGLVGCNLADEGLCSTTQQLPSVLHKIQKGQRKTSLLRFT